MSRLPISGLPVSDPGTGLAKKHSRKIYLMGMEIIDIPHKPYIIGSVKIS